MINQTDQDSAHAIIGLVILVVISAFVGCALAIVLHLSGLV